MIEQKKQRLIDILNSMIKSCDAITMDEINRHFKVKDVDGLLLLESLHDEVGIKVENGVYYITVFSIVATITAIFCGDRLAFEIDSDDVVTGVRWYKPS